MSRRGHGSGREVVEGGRVGQPCRLEVAQSILKAFRRRVKARSHGQESANLATESGTELTSISPWASEAFACLM
jgi:hypothetical protein